MDYIPNGGQTYMPFQQKTNVKKLPFTPLAEPRPAYAPLELTEAARAKGYVISTQAQHFLPGVTSKMMDWWWANMEKGYYLWAALAVAALGRSFCMKPPRSSIMVRRKPC